MTATLAAAGVTAALVAVGSASGAGGLGWLLAPTAALVELFSGVPFQSTDSGGYVNAGLGIAIGRSCAGVRFLTVAFALGVVTTLPRLRGARSRWLALAGVLCGAWVVAVLANASRISAAILLPMVAGGRGESAGGVLHLAVGIVVFSSCLVLFSLALRRAMAWSGR